MAAQRALEGLWSAEILSSAGPVNIGVVIFQPARVFGDFFENGRILGGDRHYVFRGTYAIENFGLSGKFEVARYDYHEDGPIFGSASRFAVDITGRLDERVTRTVITVAASGFPGTGTRDVELRLTRRNTV